MKAILGVTRVFLLAVVCIGAYPLAGSQTAPPGILRTTLGAVPLARSATTPPLPEQRGSGVVRQGADDNFSRYQSIIDRSPFGRASQTPEVKPQPTTPTESFTKDYKMFGIIDNGPGHSLRVGIENVKTHNSYLLDIGDQIEDNICLVSADYAEEGALLRKGSEERWIFMNAEKKGTPGTGASGDTEEQRRPRSRYADGAGPRVRGKGLTPEEYKRTKESRPAPSSPLRRKEAAETQSGPQPKVNAEQLENYLREYQMELIRAGGEQGPPLPIPLTPEMDAQLVKEGVLPPQESQETNAPAQ